jgi:hypothetical protein
MADKDKPNITAPSESVEIRTSQDANRPTENPVLFRGPGDTVDRSALAQAAKHALGTDRSLLERAAAGIFQSIASPPKPAGDGVGDGRAVEDQKARMQPPPTPDRQPSPAPDNKSHDYAGIGLFELLGLMFGLPAADALYHGKPIDSRMLGFIAAGCFFAGLGTAWPTVRKKFPQQVLVLSLSRIASDARYWLAIILVGFLYAASPEIYHRAVAPTPPSFALCTDGPCAPVHLKPGPQYVKEIGLGPGAGAEPLFLQATSIVTADRLRVVVDYSEYRNGWMPKTRAFIGEIKEPVKGKTERLQLIYSAVKANGGTNNLWWGDPSQNHPVAASTFNGSPIPAILVRGRVAIIGSNGEQHYYFILVRGAENIGTQVGIIPEHDSGDWIESWEAD